jgi:hypothetical protein
MHTALRLGFFYAAIFFTSGVQLPFWPIWLGSRGLSASEIGALLAISQWIKIAANPLAGIAADRSGAPRRIMLALSIAAVAGFVLFVPARGFASLLALGALTGAALSALLPLGDKLALAAASAGTLDYGRVRLWGSLSFIVATLLTGRLVGSGGDDSVLYLLIGSSAAIVAASVNVSVLALLQLLHALTFGAAHLGAMHHLARRLPADQAATGLALYSAVVGGIGQGLILLLGGVLFGLAGGLAFLAMAALAALGAVIALVLLATKS